MRFAMIVLMMCAMMFGGCKTVTPAPKVNDSIPAAKAGVVKFAREATDQIESITADAKEIERAATALGSPPEIVEPAKRIRGTADNLHSGVGKMLNDTSGHLDNAESERAELQEAVTKIAAERDEAILAKNSAQSAWLMRVSIACFVVGFAGFGLCFAPLIDKRLAIAIGVGGMVAGGFFAAIAKWIAWLAIGGLAAVVGGVAYGLYYLWKSGRLTDPKLAGAFKLMVEGKLSEAIALMRADPNMNLAYEKGKAMADGSAVSA